jgi:hypothetical protein
MISREIAWQRRFSPYLTILLAYSFQLTLPANADVDLGSKSDLGSAKALESKTALETPLFREAPQIALPVLNANPFETHSILPAQSELHGFVSIAEPDKTPNPSQLMDRLIQVAVSKDAAKDELDSKAHFHNKKWTRFLGRSKDMLEFMTSYQGFESSSEGADVILEEKLKLKSRAAIEFVRQRKLDSAHIQLTCALMEVATGLGLSDEQRKSQAIENGLQEMIPLVGKEEADHTLESMIAWSQQQTAADINFERDPLDVLSVRNKSRAMLACCLSDDSVVKSIEARLHRFNHISNFSRAAAKFVNTTMSIIAFSPTLASPAAQTAEFLFVACTGGPEEKKLLKEVYLDRCFESRFERLNQEIGMSINNYNSAILTRNAVLYRCSQSVMENLTTPETVASLMGGSTENISPPRKTFGERI